MLKVIRYPAAMLHVMFLLGYTPSFFGKTDIAKQSFEHVIKDSSSLKTNSDKYVLWNLQNAGLSKAAFYYAFKGYNYFLQKGLLNKTNIITIVDFSQPSTQKRLYVLDIISGKILFNTLVAHGRNSGHEYATQFSNSNRSHQSSLGFYITMGTYVGGNGYSLKLNGYDKGFNDHAYKREIVLHGADYVSENFINSNGFLGRSYGCPAVPFEFHKEIIDCIKDGSCLFLYYPSKKYLAASKILNNRNG